MTSESSKRGEGNSYQKDKEEKKNMCNVIIVKIGITWARIVVTGKTREQQKVRRKEKTLHAKIQMILKIKWLWLQLQMTMPNPKSGSHMLRELHDWYESVIGIFQRVEEEKAQT